MTSKEIAEALDVSEATVKRWRKKFGYQRARIDRRTKDGQ
jgi:DNA-binding MurR/RpiR family transcriptional regulator